jgi:hypothetical protein
MTRLRAGKETSAFRTGLTQITDLTAQRLRNQALVTAGTDEL